MPVELFEVYTAAQTTIQRRWLQRRLSDAYGGVCTIGSIYAQSLSGRENKAALKGIAKRLHRYPTYWIGYCLPYESSGRFGRVSGIAYWNDRPNRSRQTVENVFADLVAKHHPAFLVTENFKLSLKVAELKDEKKRLEERVASLQRRNGMLLRRLQDQRSIRADNEALRLLDQELDALAASGT